MSGRVAAAWIAPIAVVALALSACSGGARDTGLQDAGQSKVGTADVNPQDASRVKDGGELRWPVERLPANWNYYHLEGTQADGHRMITAVEPNLFVQESDATLVFNKDYLEDAKVTSTNPQVIEYRINPRAKWSDGASLSWEDFAAQANALSGVDPAYRVGQTAGYENIGAVEKGTTDQDVKVTFKKTFAEWKRLFTPLYPRSLNATANAFNSGWVDAPKITSGPFKVGSVDLTGKTATLVRDDNWWGERPKLDKITFRQVDRNALGDALANGQIDFYDVGSSVDLYARAKSIPGVEVRQAPTPDYMNITFNGAKGAILENADLRLAVLRGIDAKTIAKALVGPMVKGEPQVTGNHLFMVGTKQYRDNSEVASYDKEAAKKRLDELGWAQDGEYRRKGSKELSLRYVVPMPNAVADSMARLTQTQLKEIGVKVDVQTVPSAEFFKQYVNVGNFDLTGFRWLSSATPINSSKAIYYLDQKNVAQNFGRVGNDEINKLFDEATSELDDDKRADLANRADRKIWEAAHQLPLFQLAGAVVVRSNIANFGAVGFANAPFDFIHMGFTS